MIVDSVTYTGLTFDPKTLNERKRAKAPFPSHWTRVTFPFEDDSYHWPFHQDDLDRWVVENLSGAGWGSYIMHPNGAHPVVVVLFEDTADAVMFKMKDGHKLDQNTL